MTLSYNEIAKIYDTLYGEEQRQKYKTILNYLTITGVILDAGCGTGEFLKNVSKKNIEFSICLDISIEMLKIAKKKLGKKQLSDIVVGDIRKIPLRNNSIDTIVLFTVIHEIPNFVRDIIKLARKKGIIIISLLKIKKTLIRDILIDIIKENLKVIRVINTEDVKDLFIILEY